MIGLMKSMSPQLKLIIEIVMMIVCIAVAATLAVWTFKGVRRDWRDINRHQSALETASVMLFVILMCGVAAFSFGVDALEIIKALWIS